MLLIIPRFESSKASLLRLAAAHLGIVMTIRSLKLRCYLSDQRRPHDENPSSSSEIHHLLSSGRPCVIVKSSGRWTLGAHTVSRSFSAVPSCPVPRELLPSHKKYNDCTFLNELALMNTTSKLGVPSFCVPNSFFGLSSTKRQELIQIAHPLGFSLPVLLFFSWFPSASLLVS